MDVSCGRCGAVAIVQDSREGGVVTTIHYPRDISSRCAEMAARRQAGGLIVPVHCVELRRSVEAALRRDRGGAV